MAWLTLRRALVLGGIRSGKSELAEALAVKLANGAGRVRYVATARLDVADGLPDPEWAARIERHRTRRPAEWVTTEVGAEPLALADVLESADQGDTLLVDDLGAWASGVIELTPDEDLDREVIRLADAVRACRARLVLVSPEVGLSVVPATESGRQFADLLGTTNRAIAEVCDSLALVIAGNAMWLKGGP